MLDYLDGEDTITQEFEDLLLDQEIFPIFCEFLQDPTRENIFCNTIYIFDQLVYLSTRADTKMYHIFLEQGVLDVLLNIRESVPFKVLPTYLHLVANFAYCGPETRDQILFQFPPDYLTVVIVEQGETEYLLRKWGIYFIRMMTMYPFEENDKESDDQLNDKSQNPFHDFPEWIIRLFMDIFQSLDKVCLLYFLYAIENSIIMPTENSKSLVSVSMMTALDFHGMIHFFISNRNNGIVNDEILSIILKLAQYLLQCDMENLDESLIPELLEIADANYKISSELAIDIIIQCIKKSSSFKLSVIQNCSADEIIVSLWETFENSIHKMKVKLLSLFDELVGSNLETDPSLTAPFILNILPNLVGYLNDATNPEIISNILSIVGDILYLGSLMKKESEQSLLDMFYENDIFDFFSNYQNILMDSGCPPDDFDAIKAKVDFILEEYFPQMEEDEMEAKVQDRQKEFFD